MEHAGLQTAYVLHSRRYGDSSQLLDLFVRERGRVVCIAKGALRRRRTSVTNQPFQRLSVEVRGRGEVGTLSRSEAVAAPDVLSGQRLYCGLYLNELLLRLTARDDPHPMLFDAYAGAVSDLAASTPVEPLLRRFELRLLAELGLGMVLDLDSQGRPVEAERRYTYDVGCGLVRTESPLAHSVSGTTLLAMRCDRLDDATVLREARSLMRHVLDHHLDGRPLRSRELFRS